MRTRYSHKPKTTKSILQDKKKIPNVQWRTHIILYKNKFTTVSISVQMLPRSSRYFPYNLFLLKTFSYGL